MLRFALFAPLVLSFFAISPPPASAQQAIDLSNCRKDGEVYLCRQPNGRTARYSERTYQRLLRNQASPQPRDARNAAELATMRQRSRRSNDPAEIQIERCTSMGRGLFRCPRPGGGMMTLSQSDLNRVRQAREDRAGGIPNGQQRNVSYTSLGAENPWASQFSKHFPARDFVITFGKGGREFDPFYVIGSADDRGIFVSVPQRDCSGYLTRIDAASANYSDPFFRRNEGWYERASAEFYRFPVSCGLQDMAIADRAAGYAQGDAAEAPGVQYYHVYEENGRRIGNFSGGEMHLIEAGEDTQSAARSVFREDLVGQAGDERFTQWLIEAMTEEIKRAGESGGPFCPNGYDMVPVPDSQGRTRMMPDCR